jgi:hypothetical protein
VSTDISPEKTEEIKAPIAPETLYTTDYDQFHLIPDNRPIFRTHVQDLIMSYRESPALIRLKPVLVDGDLGVVDGQHRLEACKALGIPMPYQVVPGLTIDTAQLMNALQRPWRLIDFIHSYAGSGRPEYQQIERYIDDYAPIGPSVVLNYAGGTNVRNRHSTKQRARMGKLELLPGKEAEDRLSKLSSLPVTFWHYDAFAMAFLRVLKTVEKYDHKRMVEGLKNAEIKRQATMLDNLRELERAYNFKRSADIVRFF